MCSQFSWHSLKLSENGFVVNAAYENSRFPHRRRLRKLTGATEPKGRSASATSPKSGYTVALALRFLAVTVHGEASWVPSLRLSESAGDFEFDFGLFWRESRFEPNEPILMRGECKSFNSFQTRDFARARRLAETFPAPFWSLPPCDPSLNRGNELVWQSSPVGDVSAFATSGYARPSLCSRGASS